MWISTGIFSKSWNLSPHKCEFLKWDFLQHLHACNLSLAKSELPQEFFKIFVNFEPEVWEFLQGLFGGDAQAMTNGMEVITSVASMEYQGQGWTNIMQPLSFIYFQKRGVTQLHQIPWLVPTKLHQLTSQTIPPRLNLSMGPQSTPCPRRVQDLIYGNISLTR